MTDTHDNHGSTPAAWTLVVLVMIGFLVSCIALVAASEAMFFVGVGIIVVGLIVGKIMQMMRSDSATVPETQPNGSSGAASHG